VFTAPVSPTSHAHYAGRIALAIVNGQVPADVLPLAREELRMDLRGREVQQAADPLAVCRAGGSLWSWPTTAPSAGFADGKSGGQALVLH